MFKVSSVPVSTSLTTLVETLFVVSIILFFQMRYVTIFPPSISSFLAITFSRHFSHVLYMHSLLSSLLLQVIVFTVSLIFWIYTYVLCGLFLVCTVNSREACTCMSLDVGQ